MNEHFHNLTQEILRVVKHLNIDPDIELDESSERVIVLFGCDEEMTCYKFIKTVRDQLSIAACVEGETKRRFNIAAEKWFTTSAACWSVDIKFSDTWILTERLSA